MKNLNKFLICYCCGVLLCACSNRGSNDYEPIVEYHPRNVGDTQKLYIVQEYDTVGSIAISKGITRAEIINLNNLTPPYELIPGQKLIVPTKPVNADDLNAMQSKKSVNTPNITIVQEGGLQTEYSDSKNNDTLPTLSTSHNEIHDNNKVQDAPLIEDSSIQLSTDQKLSTPESITKNITEQSIPQSVYVWPVANGRNRISKKFDQQSGNVLISTPGRTPVKAIASGVVKMAGKSGDERLVRFGNMIVIQHESLSKVSIYANVIDLKIKPGQTVSAGDTIALVGQTGIRGMTTTPALYFEIDTTTKNASGKKRRPIDPCTVLP